MRVLTLNVCGLRASQKKGLFSWLKRQKADYICLQEVRASEKQIESNLDKIEEQSVKFRSKYKNIKNHPWYGFIGDNLNPYEKKELIKDLTKLKSNFDKLLFELNELQKIKKISEIKR